MSTKSRFCTFYLDRLLFGADLQTVQEVIRCPEMTRIPMSSSVFRGLINLRGQIVTAIDVRMRLEMEPFSPDALPMNVIVRYQDETISLLVDRIGDVVEVEEDAFEPCPDNLTASMRTLIGGVYKLPAQLLHVLEVEKLCKVTARPESSPTPET